MKKVFFVLCILGILMPYYQLYFFLVGDNPTFEYFVSEIYSSHPVSMITWDITIAYLSFFVFLIYQKVKKDISITKYILASFVGFSLALPLYLYDNYDR
jgi:hypothetical protein